MCLVSVSLVPLVHLVPMVPGTPCTGGVSSACSLCKETPDHACITLQKQMSTNNPFLVI